LACRLENGVPDIPRVNEACSAWEAAALPLSYTRAQSTALRHQPARRANIVFADSSHATAERDACFSIAPSAAKGLDIAGKTLQRNPHPNCRYNQPGDQ
jgi:hypothetical protein